MDVDKIEAGNDLDALIEVCLFGGTCARCQKRPEDCCERIGDFALDDYCEHRQHYSTSIEAAWKIVESRARWSPYAPWFELVQRPNGYICNFTSNARDSAFARTAPLAITKAALKAVGANHR